MLDVLAVLRGFFKIRASGLGLGFVVLSQPAHALAHRNKGGLIHSQRRCIGFGFVIVHRLQPVAEVKVHFHAIANAAKFVSGLDPHFL